MALIKVYSRINWLNKSESLTTPLGKTNLNKMDKAIDTIDNEVVSISVATESLDTTKADKAQLNNMVTDISFNDKNGVISITKYDNTVLNIDTAIEKIAVNFEYNAQTQQLILTLESGEKQYIDMSAIITQYEFKDTDTIAFSVDSDGKVSASIKSGSITKAMLSSEVMSAITLSENNAAASAQAAAQSATNADMDAKLAQSYSIGKSGIRDGEETDNAKYYCNMSENYKDNAAISEQNAKTSETNAKASEMNATVSESNAKLSETIVGKKASEVLSNAETAVGKANEANASASAASESEKNAKNSEKLSRSYAIGDADGTRENEDTDNSKWYAQQAEKYAKQAEDIAGGNFIPESEKGIAGGVAVLDANLAVAKAVADEDGNNIKKSLKGKSDSNHTHLYAGSNTAGGIANSSNLVYATSHQGEWYQNSQWDGTYFQTNYKHGDDVLPMRVGYSGYSDNSEKVNNHTVNSDVPANAKFTDTTYPISYKTIDASFLNSFRTETKGNTATGDYISTIRSEASVDGAGAYGSGLAFGRGDTHGYLYVDYNTANAYLGGGNANLLQWHKKISFSDHAHTTVNGHTVNSDVPVNAVFTDTTYSDATTSAHGLMSAGDKSKLDGIATGANKTTILNSLAATTTGSALDAVQGKALNDAIASLKKSVSDGKSAIASAITAKGVSTASDASFATMTTNIKNISTGVNPFELLKDDKLEVRRGYTSDYISRLVSSNAYQGGGYPYSYSDGAINVWYVCPTNGGVGLLDNRYILYDYIPGATYSGYRDYFSIKIYDKTTGETKTYNNVTSVSLGSSFKLDNNSNQMITISK